MQVPCPATGKPIIPDATMLMMRSATPIACPACTGTHVWDPGQRVFIAEPVGGPDPERPGKPA